MKPLSFALIWAFVVIIAATYTLNLDWGKNTAISKNHSEDSQPYKRSPSECVSYVMTKQKYQIFPTAPDSFGAELNPGIAACNILNNNQVVSNQNFAKCLLSNLSKLKDDSSGFNISKACAIDVNAFEIGQLFMDFFTPDKRREMQIQKISSEMELQRKTEALKEQHGLYPGSTNQSLSDLSPRPLIINGELRTCIPSPIGLNCN